MATRQRVTIDKRDLRRYLKENFLPRLGSEWQQSRDDMLTRRNGLIVQGVYFDRSSYGKRFVPNFFVQVLAIPVDHFTMQLGSRLRDKRGAELWLDWPSEDDVLANSIFEAYRKQANPPFDQSLTLEAAIHYIETVHRKSDHFHDRWSLGILYGFQGNLKDAYKQFDLAKRDLQKRASGWQSKGKVPPEWMESNVAEISEFMSKLETVDVFRTYCEEQAARTAAALKLSL